MSLWEYKVITSGKGGFATPVLLEKFLNDLGRDEWEIVQFHSHPDNFLAFTGLARRTTQRDWTLQDAAAAAAKAEAEKLRAEFEAKFKAAAVSAPAGGGGGGDERGASFLEEKAAPDDGFRKPVDTSRDDDPEAHDDKGEDDWDKLTAAEEDELPTFFEAMKPHMRRNQRGPGMSVGVDYLAKKWDQSEDDIRGALVECGFILPADEDSKPEYVEYEGDLYWLNINRRGELWINTKEKPRPVFRAVKAQRIAVEEEPARAPAAVFTPTPKVAAAEAAASKPETGDRTPEIAGTAEANEGAAAESSPIRNPQSAIPAAPLPPGAELLAKIRPHMRRNRRGPGGSGSTSFLGRALRTTEADLKAAFVALGLTVPTSAADKPVYVELDGDVWWLNLDSRGGLWINGREKKPGESLAAPAPADAAAPAAGSEPVASATPAPAADSGAAPTIGIEPVTEPATSAVPAPVAAPTSNSPLAAVRLLLKETKTGAIAAKAERVAEELGKSVDDLVATLVGAGLVVPEKAREKPVFVEHAGEIFWFNRNAKGELWLNAKASKFADKADKADKTDGDDGDAKKPVRRGRAKKAE